MRKQSVPCDKVRDETYEFVMLRLRITQTTLAFHSSGSTAGIPVALHFRLRTAILNRSWKKGVVERQQGVITLRCSADD